VQSLVTGTDLVDLGEMIRRLVLDHGFEGIDRSSTWDCKVLQSRSTGSSAKLFVVKLSRGGKAGPTILAKCYPPPVRPSEVWNEFRGMSITYRGLSGSNIFGVPKPLACFPERGVLLMERCHGRSFKDLLFGPLRFSRWFADEDGFSKIRHGVQQTASLLLAYQDIQLGGEFEPSLPQILRRYASSARDYLHLCSQVGIPNSLIREGEKVVSTAFLDGPAVGLVSLQHSDFAPWNLLVGNRLFLLDFQGFSQGLLEYDLTFFETALTLLLRYRWVNPDRINIIKETFLDAYRSRRSVSDHLLRALRIAHLAYFCSVIVCDEGVGWGKAAYLVPPVPFFRRAIENALGSH